MSFEYCVLGSGSGGNSIAFWDGETAFLIDAGFSCKEIARRLNLAGIDAKEIDAIFISHEHVDHARGARVFGRRFGPRVYCTPTVDTWMYSRYGLEAAPELEPGEQFELNGFKLKPFEVPHDASQTVGFVVNHGRKKVSVATDLGHMSSKVRIKFRNCDAIILESNHDVQMLKEGPYPVYLKKRILSDRGHLSNAESAASLATVISERTKHVTLAHLSRENNTPAVALKEAKKHLSQISRRVKVVPADQFEVCDVVKI
jgi:phosphoribosyl 1,2-cyclic phosphodiesterase